MKLYLILFLILLGINQQLAQGVDNEFKCDADLSRSEPCFISWSPDGQWIATTRKSVIKVDIWNAKTEALFRTLPTHADVLTWNKQGNLLATVTEYEINIWDVNSGEQINSIDFTEILESEFDRGLRESWPYRFNSISWNNTTSQIAIVTSDWLGIWHPETTKFSVIRFSNNPHVTQTLSATWNPSGTTLALVFTGGEIWLYDSITLAVEKQFQGESLIVSYPGFQAASWSPDGDFIASDALHPEGDAIRVADVATEDETSFLSHQSWLSAVDWSPDGELIASAGGLDWGDDPPDHAIRIWKAATHELVFEREYDQRITSISWDPEGKKLAAVDLDGLIHIINVD